MPSCRRRCIAVDAPVALAVVLAIAVVAADRTAIVVLAKFLRALLRRAAGWLRGGASRPGVSCSPKILIANRGEIACRVAATARRLGVHRGRLLRRRCPTPATCACDEAVHIGGNAPRDSYLRWSASLEAARATGAQAIHPGYGFLSENEEFARPAPTPAWCSSARRRRPSGRWA